MHTCFCFENALLNFPPNLFNMLRLELRSCAFGCAFMSLLTMMGNEGFWKVQRSLFDEERVWGGGQRLQPFDKDL